MGNGGTVDLGGCGALDALVTAVVDTRREIAALQSREARLLAGAVDLVAARTAERLQQSPVRRANSDLPLREVCAELAAAMRLSDRAVQGRMSDATTLLDRFARTLAAWESGRIDAAHVSAILDAGAPIYDEQARGRFEQFALAVAETESPQRLRAAVGAIAVAVDPDGATERARGARAQRKIRVSDLGDDMSRILADVPTPLASGILDRLTQLAHEVLARTDEVAATDEADGTVAADETTGTDTAGGGVDGGDAGAGAAPTVVTGPSNDDAVGDTRTMDQVRVDVFCDLLLGGGPVAHGDGLEAITGHVQVLVPASTLNASTGGSAFLAGHGPTDPDTARCLAARATGWDRLVSDPLSGAVLAIDRYQPTGLMRRFLCARDERCRFPGCRRPARRCDLDHTCDAALGGPTSCTNLAHLCRRHHTLKHATEWAVRQLGHGVLEWMSPTGRAYLDRPPGMVRFVPSDTATANDGDPPPF